MPELIERFDYEAGLPQLFQNRLSCELMLLRLLLALCIKCSLPGNKTRIGIQLTIAFFGLYNWGTGQTCDMTLQQSVSVASPPGVSSKPFP